MAKEKRPKKKGNFFKKATLGMVAASVAAGAGGGVAQAGHTTDMLKGGFSDLGSAISKNVTGVTKLAVTPWAAAADTFGWARKNPKKAAGLAAMTATATAAVIWAGLSHVDTSDGEGILTSAAKGVRTLLEPAGKKIEDFFGGSKAGDMASGAYKSLSGSAKTYLGGADNLIKSAGKTVQSANVDAVEWWNTPGIGAQMMKAYTDIMVSASEKLDDFIKNASAKASELQGKYFEGVEAFQSAASAAKTQLAQNINDAKDAAFDMATKGSQAAKDMGENLLKAGIETGKTITKTAADAGKAALETGVEAGKTIAKTAVDAGNLALEAGEEIAKNQVVQTAAVAAVTSKVMIRGLEKQIDTLEKQLKTLKGSSASSASDSSSSPIK